MRNRFIILIAGTLVVLLAWFMFAYRPASSKLAEVKAQVQTTRNEIAALETRLAALQEMQRNEKELRKLAAKFEKALPADPGVSRYIRQVEKIAKEAKIDFITISPSLPGAPTPVGAPSTAPAAPAPTSPTPGSPPPDAAAAAAPAAAPAPAVTVPLRSISISISAGGKFFDIENFIAKMENLDRAVRIDDFSLSGGAEGLSLSMKLQMWMGGVPEPAPISAPAAGGGAPGAVDRFSGGLDQGVE